MKVILNADSWGLDGRLRRGAIELGLILGHAKGRWAARDSNAPWPGQDSPTATVPA